MLAHVARRGGSKLAAARVQKRNYASKTESLVAKYTQNGRPESVVKYVSMRSVGKRLGAFTRKTNTLWTFLG